MRYVATINIPGYLPMDDEPPVFDTAAAAWEYLADERRRAEDEYPMPDDPSDPEGPQSYSDTVLELENAGVRSVPEVGTVYGRSPATESGIRLGDAEATDSYDLGLAYSVDYAEQDDDED